MNWQDTLHIILVSPDEDANIGAVCRGMKNMGFTRLVLTGRKDFDLRRIRTLAVHAYDVFEKARLCGSLEEAVADSVLTAGFTRRLGRWRKYVSHTPEQFARRITGGGLSAGAPVSLVFGNEERGLTDEELSICDMAVHIPSDPSFPSLNLSHAVQIACYCLRTSHMAGQNPGPGGAEHGPPRDRTFVSRRRNEELVRRCMDSLQDIGFFTLKGRDEMSVFFRDIFARALISEGEAKRLEDIFTKIAKLKLHRRVDEKRD